MDILGEDDFEEKQERERQELIEEMKNNRPEPLEAETGIELQQFMIQPTAEKLFYFITKDMTVTYLDDLDMVKVRQLCNLIVTLIRHKLYINAKEFYGDLATILNSARSRHGFERQMEQTNIGKSFQYYDGQEQEGRKR